MPKFSALTALTGPNVAAGDLLCVDDVSATTSKKVTFDSVLQGALVASSNAVLDANSNELMKFSTTGSAVNEITVANAATGSGPTVAVTGGDTNAPLSLDGKGSGVLNLNVNATGNVKVGTSLQFASAKSIVDANGNEQILWPATVASAVNQWTFTNSATTAPVLLAATGDDTNIGVKVNSKGSGTITFNDVGTGNVILGVTTLQFPSAGIVADTNGNELLKFPATVASAINELTLTNAAAGNPVLLASTGGDTNVGMKVNGKGSGTITLNDVGTGNVILGRTLQFPSAGILADPNGNELIKFPATVASAINEVTVTNAAASSFPSIAATGGDTNIDLLLDGKATGNVSVCSVGTGNLKVGTNVQLVSAGSIVDANGNEIVKSAATVSSAVNEVNITNSATGNPVLLGTSGGDTNINLKLVPKGSGVVQVDGGVLSIDPSDGVGYATGAGGAVTQATSRTTAVIINKVTGAITLFSAAGSATPFSFTVTNSVVAATDTIVLSQKSGTDKYTTQVVTNVAAGSFQITLANASGTTTEQPVFNFTVIKGVAA